MPDSLVPPPPPTPYQALYWGPNQTGAAGQTLTIGQNEGPEIASALAIFNGTTYQRGFSPGLQFARVGGNNAGADILGRISLNNGVTGGIGPQLEQPGAGWAPVSRSRVYIGLFVNLRLSGVVGNWGNETGFYFRAERTGVGFWTPDAGVTVDRAGLGIVGDQAGGWQFVSKVNDNAVAVYDEIVPIVWPVPLTEFATVGFQFFSATPTTLARVVFSLAGVPVLERSWAANGTSPTLPSWNAADASGNFGWAIGCNSVALGVSPALRLDVSDIVMIKGPMIQALTEGGSQ